MARTIDQHDAHVRCLRRQTAEADAAHRTHKAGVLEGMLDQALRERSAARRALGHVDLTAPQLLVALEDAFTNPSSPSAVLEDWDLSPESVVIEAGAFEPALILTLDDGSQFMITACRVKLGE